MSGTDVRVHLRRPYPTNLTNEEWKYLSPLFPAEKPRGKPRMHSVKEICDAIFSWCGEDAPGGCCPLTSRLGLPSTIGSGDGA